MLNQLKAKFEELFGKDGDIRSYFAPGRVNLIGEHTDYNGGHVFPCALTLGTYGIARKRSDKKLRFYSLNFPHTGIIEASLDGLEPSSSSDWTNYPKGVFWTFEKHGHTISQGVDLLIYGTIPNASGLSSSASLEVLTALVIKDLFGFDQLSMTDLALYGQYSENNFNGMNCGIMDQFAVAMGKKDNAIFLDTSTLEFEYAPVILEDAQIVITNSKVKHSLVDSAYNERRKSCELALKELQAVTAIQTLGDLSEAEFETLKDTIKDDRRRAMAKHAVYENQRTIKAVEALKNNDIKAFGHLMNESHISLRDDYKVSCEEIDLLVDTAWAIPGVLGARITGGGFGGCTVSIVKTDAVEQFKEKLQSVYQEKLGLTAEFYVAEIGNGASRLD